MPEQTLMEQAIISSGGTQEFYRKYNEYCQNDSFIQKNIHNLLKTHDNSWIAIYNGKLQAHAKKWDTIINNVQRKGLPSDEVVIQFISSKPRIMIL
jgi:adenine specific DNA methylase Mod